MAVLRKIAEKASGERVAGAGRISNCLERVGWRAEDVFLEEQKRTVLSQLHDHRVRPHRAQRFGHRQRMVITGELSRLLLVDDENVDAPE